MIEAITILTEWIEYARQNNMIMHVKGFWLLRDYLEGDIWSKKFHDKHLPNVKMILNSLNTDKKDVKIIIDEFVKKELYEYPIQIELFEFPVEKNYT